MSLTAFINLNLKAILTDSTTLAIRKDETTVINNESYSADDISKVYRATRSIDGEDDETIDLSDLTDAFGNALSFTKINVIYFKNLATATDSVLTIGGGPNAFETNQVLGPGAFVLIDNPEGITVSATGSGTGTDKILVAAAGNIVSGTGTTEYEVILVGE